MFLAGIMRKHGLSRADAEKLFDSNDQSRRNGPLERQWVRNLDIACRAICANEDEALTASTFWIGLYGALAEIMERFRKSVDDPNEGEPTSLAFRFFAAQRGVFEACQAVRDSLTEDDLVCLTMLRHIHTHVYQRGFEYRLKTSNRKDQPATVQTTQTIGLIGRSIDVDEAHAVLDRMCTEHDEQGGGLVRYFAQKVQPAVQQLQEAMIALGACLGL